MRSSFVCSTSFSFIIRCTGYNEEEDRGSRDPGRDEGCDEG